LRLQNLSAKARPQRRPATPSPRRPLANFHLRFPDLLPSRVPSAPSYRSPRLRRRAAEHKEVHLAPGMGLMTVNCLKDHVLWRQRSTRCECARR